MDVLAELKHLQCDPGPVHSPNECPCDMEQPCACVVYGAAIDEIIRLRKAESTARAAFNLATEGWPFERLNGVVTRAEKHVADLHTKQKAR